MKIQAQSPLHYSEIPDTLKAKASVVFLGKYRSYRVGGFLHNGRNRHRISHGFEVTKVLKGQVKSQNVPRLGQKYYKVYHYYWILLSPSQKTQGLLLQELIDPKKMIVEEGVLAILPDKIDAQQKHLQNVHGVEGGSATVPAQID